MVRACLLSGIVVTVLEMVQAWAPVRHPRFSDALVGFAVGVAGALGAAVANVGLRNAAELLAAGTGTGRYSLNTYSSPS